MNRHRPASVAIVLLALGAGCSNGNEAHETATAAAPPTTALQRGVDVCAVLPTQVVGDAIGVAINDTARLIGDGDPRACAYYLGDADTDPGYAVSVITSPDNGQVVVDSRCRADEGEGVLSGLEVLVIDRGDEGCAVDGHDLVVRRDDGYVEVAIGILTVDLPDDEAYRNAAVAIYDALEPSL